MIIWEILLLPAFHFFFLSPLKFPSKIKIGKFELNLYLTHNKYVINGLSPQKALQEILEI